MSLFEKLIPLLFAVTLVAIFTKDKLLEQTIEITADSVLYDTVYDDSPSKGNSVVELISTENQTITWTCTIQQRTIPFPYCGLALFVGQSDADGLDLRTFHTLRLWVDYQGPTESLKIFLRNFDNKYSEVYDYTSTKYNTVEISKDHLEPGVGVNFRNFNVPSWWQLERNISPEDMAPDFSNVINLDFQTGSRPIDGVHTFTFHKVELVGQWLTTEAWYLSIITFWGLIFIGKIAHHQIELLSKIKHSSKREKELEKINILLDREGRKLQQKVETDKLTGAYNRTGAEIKLADALQEKQQNGYTFSIILLDIDHFKKINDTYGHDAGDQVLQQFSEHIQKNIRATDYFARWGGEEFMLICRKTTLKTAAEIAEQLREIVSTSILIGETLVTASMGVAEIKGNDQASINDAFKRADQALYKAKRNGRNRVELADDSLTTDQPFPAA